MRNRIVSYIKSYNALYWISICIITILSVGLFLSNNFSAMPANRMIDDAVEDSERISESLSKTKESFAAYEEMLGRIASTFYVNPENWPSNFYQQAVILFDGFYTLHPYVSGYFINIDDSDSHPLLQKYHDFNTGKETHISVFVDSSYIYGSKGLNEILRESSEPVFTSIPSSFIGGFELSYIVPLYIQDEYRGLFGVVLDKESLGGMFGEKSSNWRQMTLLTNSMEIISSTSGLPVGNRLVGADYQRYSAVTEAIESSKNTIGYYRENHGIQSWMNIFVKLPSGQIFLESFSLFHWLMATNLLILLLFLSAIFCIWFVQKRNGVSPFDKLSDFALTKTRGISEEIEIANKASFSLHITILFVTFTLIIFALISNASLVETIAFVVFLLLTILMLNWYRKGEHKLRYVYLYLMFFLLAPVIMHHITGGFASKYAGQIIIFSVMPVILSSFILRNKKNMGIFPIFVVVLFLDTIIEIYTVNMAIPETAIRFINVMFFIGFAMFLSTDLYVTGVNGLLAQLKNTQSMLVQKEKMVTLGRLIAGIAHELNTPLGAIKASVENIESTLNPAFAALMDAGTQLSHGDRELYFRLVDIATNSMEDMYTTIQIRRAKPLIREFLDEIGREDPQETLDTLVRLEICNIDTLRQNRDIFESPNIQTLLNLLLKTASIMRSSYIISQSTAKTSKIVFALKSYSHTTISPDPIWLNVVQNIDNVLVLLYNQMKSGIELTRDYDEDIPEILGNPDELGQVWINLFQNAIHAMGGVGALDISIKNEGDEVHISITDSGCGIAPEAIGHIFEPFYTTKDIGEGSGLGLDICKKILTNHGGRIGVQSKLGVGATFDVWLPFHPVDNS